MNKRNLYLLGVLVMTLVLFGVARLEPSWSGLCAIVEFVFICTFTLVIPYESRPPKKYD